MLPAPRSVWIVDDSQLDGERARRCLASQHSVELFSDGSVMLEQLSAGRTPDVLVLDWVMPGLSGLELCEFIRAREGNIPRTAILLLTSQNESEQVVQALDSGANDFLSKPYAEAELRARVAAMVRNLELVERVERVEQSLRTLLSNAPDALLSIDSGGLVSFANAEAERLFARSSGELVGRSIAELLPDFRPDALRLGGSEALFPLPDVRVGDRIYSPTVRDLTQHFTASRTIALHDVTERRRTEARRLDFYSIIAHDLRSPLSAMMLRTGAILSGRRGVLSAPLTDDVRKIDINLRSMVALINDFLDLARLEGAGYKVERQPLDVQALVEATIEDVRPLAEQSQLRLEVSFPDGGVEVAGDRRRLSQVLTNLLSNAIKFTPAGGVVTTRVTAGADEVEIAVEDTGRGIAPEALATLFDRYTRVIDPQHQVAGTGLGLMIVREIVDAHGGTVTVRSQPRQGSTFTVRLPREKAPQVHGGVDILVVDDDEDIRESLVFVLEAEGFEVATAAGGEEALALLDVDRPSLVLLDLMMPSVSGWDVLERMRAQPRLAKIPVCVISASINRHEEVPGVTVMPKPIDVERLLEYVGKHCSKSARTRALANSR